MACTAHIGTSGYQYDHWKGHFYPEHLRKEKWFRHYAEHFDCVEINSTFYGLPSESTVDAWREVAPPGFRYALKFSRYGTHLRKLKDPRQTIGAFLARAERLKSHLGPILVQLPPRWKRDVTRLRGFLDEAPRRHRWAFEIRDESWLHNDVYAVLADHGAALVHHDMTGNHPWVETSNFVYLRLYGNRCRGSYSLQELRAQMRRLRRVLERGHDA